MRRNRGKKTPVRDDREDSEDTVKKSPIELPTKLSPGPEEFSSLEEHSDLLPRQIKNPSPSGPYRRASAEWNNRANAANQGLLVKKFNLPGSILVESPALIR